MKIKKERLKAFIYPAAFVLIAVLSLMYRLFMNGTTDNFVKTVKGENAVLTTESAEQSVTETEAPTQTTEQTEPATVQVYVCGAVQSPGVYEVPRGVILNDAIACAGGFTETADLTKVNLVYTIDSNVSVYIPDAVQTEESVSEEVFAGQEDIIREDDEYIWGEDAGSQGADQNLININTASKEELMTLPGIGEVSAQAIIDYRELTPFANIEDIKNVSGIGDGKFDKIKDLITV